MRRTKRAASIFFLGAALAACGGEPPPPLPVLDEVDVLVQDDFLLEADCPQIAGLALRGRVKIEGIAATCGLTIQQDGQVLSICGDVPGQQTWTLTVEYLADDGPGELLVMSLVETLDLTSARRSPVPLDLSRVEARTTPDQDDDGASNLEELCQGTDPRAP